ncbi:MAG: NUDIX hydrolase [Actinomycetia bacterium]|nr:NUDIX hydrolase [Actinomycetes bacterium]
MRTEYFSETADRLRGISPYCRPGQGDVLVDNGAYGQILHAAVLDDADGLLYDLPVQWDKGGGGVAIPVKETGEICFIQIFRPVAAEPHLVGTEKPPPNLSQLGVVSLELPRGFAEDGEGWATTALREANEELRLRVSDETEIGWVNPNTSTTVHSAGVVVLRAGPAANRTVAADAQGAEAERILSVHAMSEAEVWRAIRDGRIFCGFTLAALMLYFATRTTP